MNILNIFGKLLSFDFIERYAVKKLSSGGAASAIAAIAGVIIKYGLGQYGIAIDDHGMISISLEALLTGGVLAVINAMKHAGRPK